jgi:hypothetical protein
MIVLIPQKDFAMMFKFKLGILKLPQRRPDNLPTHLALHHRCCHHQQAQEKHHERAGQDHSTSSCRNRLNFKTK